MRSAALALSASVLVAGCGWFGGGAGKPEGPPPVSGLEAMLRPIGGSAVQGNANFSARSGGVTMRVQLHGSPGTQYRVVVHANGNCSSPNGFSAGPPLLPPGAATVDARPFTTNGEGSGDLTVRLDGYALSGPSSIDGKSVVVHEGARGSLETKPDVPNDRVACGVIGPLQTLF